MLEQLLKQPGFIYEISGKYYFLGKWICKECTNVEATDSVFMYQMCRRGGEVGETQMYYMKIRAFADFALEIPYNAAKIKADMTALLEGMSGMAAASLEKQLKAFAEDLARFGA